MSDAEYYKDPLLQQLHSDGLLDRKQADEVLDEHERTGKPVREIARDMQLVDEDQLLEVVAGQMGVEVIDLAHSEIPQDVVRSVPGSVCPMHNAVPVETEGNSVTMAIYDLISPDGGRTALCSGQGHSVRGRPRGRRPPFLTSTTAMTANRSPICSPPWRTCWSTLERTTVKVGGDDAAAEIEEMANQAPVIRFVNLVLLQAVKDRASDIHFEPFENEFKIRYRVDGALYEMARRPSIWRCRSSRASRSFRG
jgi:type IV pilus assembly protein PilB